MPASVDHTAGLPVYADGRPPLTSHVLRRMLLGEPNRLIVLAADSEGNHFSPLYEVGMGLFDARQLRDELYPTRQQMDKDRELADLVGPLPAGLREVIALYPAG
ncbi:hypothetical protein ACWD26_43125 [Streptomyces sp. NPDC002787]